MSDIHVQRDGDTFLVKAELGMQARLLEEGFTILGTVQKDSVTGSYFSVMKAEMTVDIEPFRDTSKRSKPMDASWMGRG